jgi:hypothetical protein
MSVTFGQAKYEQGSKNYFSFKKDQNSFILRIVPPMGELAESGKWSLYHRVEFGYKGSDGRMKPFLSPRVVNYQKMVEQESLAHLRREKITKQMDEAKRAGNDIVAAKCNDILRTYNQDAKHYMNTIDLQGNVGLFKIGHKGFQALKAEIDRLRTEGVDPISVDNGRYFVFARSGTGRDTLYTVKEYKQKQEIDGPNGKIVADVSFPHAIDAVAIAKIEEGAFNLKTVYPSVTPEEEKLIVEGGPAGVDAVFAKKNDNPASTTTAAPAPQAEAPVQQAAPQAEVQVEQPLAKSETVQQETVQAETVKPEATTTQEAPAAQATDSTDIGAMSDEDFFKQMENGNF